RGKWRRHMRLTSRIRIIAGAFALAVALAIASASVPQPASAQQQVNPTADSVKEQQLLNQLNVIKGRGTIPDTRACVIVLLAIFYLWRGTIPIEEGRSGRLIVRFGGFERFVHWMTATAFVVLAITG